MHVAAAAAAARPRLLGAALALATLSAAPVARASSMGGVGALGELVILGGALALALALAGLGVALLYRRFGGLGLQLLGWLMVVANVLATAGILGFFSIWREAAYLMVGGLVPGAAAWVGARLLRAAPALRGDDG